MAKKQELNYSAEVDEEEEHSAALHTKLAS